MGGECGEEGVGETEGSGESLWGGVWEGGGVWRAGWGGGEMGGRGGLCGGGGGGAATWSPWSSSFLTPESDHFGTSLPLSQPGIKS